MAVVAFDVGTAEGAGTRIAVSRLADLAAVYCESYRHWSACAATASRVYAVVSADDRDDNAAPTALATAILGRAGQALRVDVRAGIGSVVAAASDLVTSRREADEVLDVLAAGPAGSVASIGSVRSKVILHRLTQLATRDQALASGKVAALAEQDAVKGTAWVPTLRAYFDAFGDMAVAAAAVNVHPNTFRYRLRRITEVFGLDLSDPDERLVAELQLRFLEPPG
jgi:DNA-binding PucR family transcriptional regulator